MTRRTTSLFALVAVLLVGRAAFAQDVALPEPVTAPSAQNKEGEPEIALDADREIDLANVVTSAAKGVTTVQEAPAIITIITSDEIKARGFRFVEDALSTVPGWMTTTALGQNIPAAPLVRGVGQAVLLLRDGISQFEPYENTQAYRTAIPMESIKRLEIVTGPGGPLWGANSYMGIVNIIMKDAEDVNGLEVSAGYGDGQGFRQDARAYGMFGKTFLNGKLKIFQHVSYENYLGSIYNLPQFLAATPAPQPSGTAYFGGLSEPYPNRSWMLFLDGKYSLGPVSLTYQIPFGAMSQQLTFANAVVPNNNTSVFNRFIIVDYHDRFWKDRFGLTVKGYWSQFVNEFSAELFPPQFQFPSFTGPLGNNIGGVHFTFNPQYSSLIQRAGVTLDSDLNFQKIGVKILFGGEFFDESVSGLTESFPSAPYSDPSMATNSMTGKVGVPTATPAGLPLVCPQTSNGMGGFVPVPQCPRVFVNNQYRLVAAGYADLQYRPWSKLTLDGGIRLQYGFGGRGYDLTPLYSGAAVWNFLPDYHLKLNYTTGFRAPPFADTDAPGGGISYGANPRLKNESSQSFQGELNARLLRNVRKVRELELRVDYSYTYLSNFIEFRGSEYANTGTRGIHSVEAFAKLYLAGDHFLTASYTFLYSVTTDLGVINNLPNHWASLGASFNIIKQTLDVNANLLITGAYEDPNRAPGSPSNLPGTTTSAQATDLTLDRLTPVAVLQLGFRLRFLHERLAFSAQFYNVFNQHYYPPDPFYDVTPSVELTPAPAPGFNFFASATYHF